MKKAITLFMTLLLVCAAAKAAPTIEQCTFSQPISRPGYGVMATFNWEAQTVTPDLRAFVHIWDSTGKQVFQADHLLPTPTSQWSGHVKYDVLINIPTNTATGQYSVNAGLWNTATGNWYGLTPGPGVIDRGNHSYCIGFFKVNPTAPYPKLAPPTLTYTGYTYSFKEEFNTALSVSSRGPGTKWFAHLPDYDDFGDAPFADPGPNTPFKISGSTLSITASKKNGYWQSGLLCSWDYTGHGFAQTYGYWEMRAKLPKGEGTWPAFWLLSTPQSTNLTSTRVEIDMFEQYGVMPNTINSRIHYHEPDGSYHTVNKSISAPTMTEEYHRYGVKIDPTNIIFYFDGSEYWRVATSAETRVPLYVIANLAIGGGWPTTNLPNPSSMLVDYIRVWKRQ